MNNIIAGEAPESDDEEVYTPTVTTLHNISPGSPTTAEVLSRLASFADDSAEGFTFEQTADEEDQHLGNGDDGGLPAVLSLVPDLGVTELQIEPLEKREDMQYIPKQTPVVSDSLLHRKLRECNETLHTGIQTVIEGWYEQAAKDLNSSCQLLNKSKASVQDISNKMRTTTNDLFQIEDTLDAINGLFLLPNIKPCELVPKTNPS